MTQEELIEKVAEGLWHRFAPAHHMELEHETHKAEYRDAARAALSIALEEAAKVAVANAVSECDCAECVLRREIGGDIRALIPSEEAGK